MRSSKTTAWWTLCAAGLAALTGARAGHTLQAETPAPKVPPLILEDFEGVTFGAKPYLWKDPNPRAATVTIGAERAELDGREDNKALKFEYAFPAAFNAEHAAETGPQGQALPGSLASISMMVYGDAGKNNIAVRIKDRQEEPFEWQVPITWTGWKKVQIPMDLRYAAVPGTRRNGTLDLPLTLDLVRVARTPAGARKGEIMVDDLVANCTFGRIATLYDTAEGVKLDGWKANRNNSRIGLIADSLVPRGGKDQAVLKLEYEYDEGDASVEYAKTIPAGDGHGTFIAEIFGDGSNNVLRFRVLDGQDRVWQARWANALVDWSGWKTVYFDTRTFRDPDGQDPGAVIEKFPVKFYSIVVDDVSGRDYLPGAESGRKGEIFLGRLLFGAEK